MSAELTGCVEPNSRWLENRLIWDLQLLKKSEARDYMARVLAIEAGCCVRH